MQLQIIKEQGIMSLDRVLFFLNASECHTLGHFAFMAKVKRESKLTNVAAKAENGAKAGLILAANIVAQRATREAPVDTGRLKRSLSKGNPERSGENWKIAVGTNVIYAPYQEFGTKLMSAQPFLRPALQNTKDITSRLIAKTIVSFIVK